MSRVVGPTRLFVEVAMNKSLCILCVFLGALAPWVFLVAAGYMSVFHAYSPKWSETAAYLSGFALLLLSVSYILQRIHRTHSN